MKKFVLTTSIVSLSLLSQAQISLFNNEVEQQWHEISFMVNQGTVYMELANDMDDFDIRASDIRAPPSIEEALGELQLRFFV